MGIAICCILTGRYEVFWESLYQSLRMHFLPDVPRVFHVFTDSSRLLAMALPDCVFWYEPAKPWPLDTLLRFHMFCRIQDQLSMSGHVFFFNANSRMLRPFPEDPRSLCSPGHLLLWEHSNLQGQPPDTFRYERNPASAACIPLGQGDRYYGGGFFGGCTDDFLSMCRSLRNNIEADLHAGVTALFHDESHLNRYALDHEVCVVPSGWIAQASFFDEENGSMVFQEKIHFGGEDRLRGVSWGTRLRRTAQKGVKYLIVAPFRLGPLGAVRLIRQKWKARQHTRIP